MFTHELSNGVRISPVLMAVGAGGAVACLTALENGKPNWPLAGFWGFVFLLLPHLLEVVWAGVVTVRRPAPEPEPPVVDVLDEPPDAPYDAQAEVALALAASRIRAVLSAARAVNGVNGTIIPRWASLDSITRPMWTAATDDLQAAGYIVKYPGEGTVLTEGGTLGRLYALACRPDFDPYSPAPDDWPGGAG